MALKLSEKIKQQAQNIRQNQQAGMAGTKTQQAFQQAAVAQGKAGTAAPSGQSNIDEILGIQQQRMQGEQAAEQLEQQAGQVAVQEEAQESEERQHQAIKIAEKLESDANYNQLVESEFNKYEQFRLDMSDEEEQLALENLGFQLALKDKAYLAQLDRRAKEENLRDELAFKEQTAKTILGEELNNFRKDLAFQEQQFDLDLQNREDLAKINIDAALAAGAAALEEDLVRQKSQAWSDLFGAASSGMLTYAKYKKDT